MLRCRIPGKSRSRPTSCSTTGWTPRSDPGFWRIPRNCRLQNRPGLGWAGLELVWEGIFWEFLAFPSSPSRGRGRDELHGFLRSPRPDFWEHPGPGWIRALAAQPFPFQPQRAGMGPGSRSGNENPGLGMRSCSWVVPPGNSRFSGERGRLRRQSRMAPRGNWLRAGIAPSGGSVSRCFPGDIPWDAPGGRRGSDPKATEFPGARRAGGRGSRSTRSRGRKSTAAPWVSRDGIPVFPGLTPGAGRSRSRRGWFGRSSSRNSPELQARVRLHPGLERRPG